MDRTETVAEWAFALDVPQADLVSRIVQLRQESEELYHRTCRLMIATVSAPSEASDLAKQAATKLSNLSLELELTVRRIARELS